MLMLYLFRAFHTCAHTCQTVKHLQLQGLRKDCMGAAACHTVQIWFNRNLTCGIKQQSAIVRLSPWLYFPCLGCSIFSSRSNL